MALLVWAVLFSAKYSARSLTPPIPWSLACIMSRYVGFSAAVMIGANSWLRANS